MWQHKTSQCLIQCFQIIDFVFTLCNYRLWLYEDLDLKRVAVSKYNLSKENPFTRYLRSPGANVEVVQDYPPKLLPKNFEVPVLSLWKCGRSSRTEAGEEGDATLEIIEDAAEALEPVPKAKKE